jgi:hypothetical protein
MRAAFDVVEIHVRPVSTRGVAVALTAPASAVGRESAMNEHRTHTYPVPRCLTTISTRLAMCKTHWYRVPLDLRTQLWNAVVPGQLEGETPPTDEYLAIF